MLKTASHGLLVSFLVLGCSSHTSGNDQRHSDHSPTVALPDASTSVPTDLNGDRDSDLAQAADEYVDISSCYGFHHRVLQVVRADGVQIDVNRWMPTNETTYSHTEPPAGAQIQSAACFAHEAGIASCMLYDNGTVECKPLIGEAGIHKVYGTFEFNRPRKIAATRGDEGTVCVLDDDGISCFNRRSGDFEFDSSYESGSLPYLNEFATASRIIDFFEPGEHGENVGCVNYLGDGDKAQFACFGGETPVVRDGRLVDAFIGYSKHELLYVRDGKSFFETDSAMRANPGTDVIDVAGRHESCQLDGRGIVECFDNDGTLRLSTAAYAGNVYKMAVVPVDGNFQLVLADRNLGLVKLDGSPIRLSR
jgi:hypothetical protein